MALVLVALATGLLAGLVLGGSVRSLARARLHGLGLLLAGAICELGARWIGGGVEAGMVVAGYVLMICFALRNAGLTGMVLVAVGLVANLAVIVVDQGMPVRGLPAGVSDGWRHHGERAGDHLTGLADVVRLAPLGETVSAGDIVLSLGAGTAVVALMRPRRRPAPSGAR
jgi:Family of unknown function (DUF5317)